MAAVAQHCSYSGEAGPENGSKVDPENVMCALGRNQSPIDLGGFVEAELKPLKLAYQAGAADIVNNGHTVQVNQAPGSTLAVDGRSLGLKRWLVLKRAASVSKELDRFANVAGFANNRPIQAINARPVLR